MKHLLTLFLVCSSLLLQAQWWNDSTYDWSKAKRLHKGILCAQWKTKSPRIMKIVAVRIDLNTKDLDFHTTPPAENYGQKMPDAQDFIIRTRRETTRKFFESLQKHDVNVIAAFNAAPWSPWRKPFTHKYADRMGFLVSDGKVVMEPDGKRPSFVQYTDGKVDLVRVTKDADLSKIKNAVSGFSFVLQNGEVTKSQSQALAPRTGYGISKDKRYFYVFIVDGRQPKYSMGMNHREVGEFLKYLGSHIGINMDGGGSSTMIVKRKKKTEMLNQQPGKSERTVGASLAVSVGKR
ncbi:MAG: phosphodiester glycosidase family protein [Lentisphaeria bacterium]|nr:phosphodiester glycosidase family protein [Lentisphaeria bacterium]